MSNPEIEKWRDGCWDDLAARMKGKEILCSFNPELALTDFVREGLDTIPDAELIHRVILNLAKAHGNKRRPLWSAVHAMFGLGSTYSKLLCRRYDLDPEELVA